MACDHGRLGCTSFDGAERLLLGCIDEHLVFGFSLFGVSTCPDFALFAITGHTLHMISLTRMRRYSVYSNGGFDGSRSVTDPLK